MSVEQYNQALENLAAAERAEREAAAHERLAQERRKDALRIVREAGAISGPPVQGNPGLTEGMEAALLLDEAYCQAKRARREAKKQATLARSVVSRLERAIA